MRRLGKFEIIERLGAGGMGVVYRARDLELGRQVALKVLPDEVQAVSDRRIRFLHEARAAAALNHPAIATLYEFGEAPDELGQPRLFLAMELVEGEDLQSILLMGALPVGRALRIGRQLAAGLAAAHDQGIVHRDLKPANVRVMHNDRIKILDFGLAKVADPVSPDLPRNASVTREGTALGSAPYMAPEQARGEKVDARADLFSLGVMLFEMIAGFRPFPGRHLGEYLLALEKGPAADLNPETPGLDPALARLVARLQERDRSLRYGSAAELEQELATLEKRSSRVSAESAANLSTADTWIAAEPRPRSRWRMPRAALWSSLAVAAALILFLVAERRATPGTDVATTNGDSPLRLAVAPFENLTGDAELDFTARALAADIAGELSNLPELAVVSSVVTATYGGRGDRYARLADEHSVQRLIEGGLQLEDGALRVRVSLADTTDGRMVWSDVFMGAPDELFQLQTMVAGGVGESLRSSLSERSFARLARAPTQSNEAFSAYLDGLRYSESYADEEDLQTAILYFEQALALDPGFASARARLALALLQHAERSRDLELLERGMAEARLALERDPGLIVAQIARALGERLAGRPEAARRVLGELGQRIDGELAAALDGKTRVEMMIESAQALRADNQLEAATAKLQEATRDASDNWQAWHALGHDSMLNGRYTDARREFESALELEPGQSRVLANLVALELFADRTAAAKAIIERIDGPISNATLASNAGYLFFQEGDFEKAERYFRQARRLRPNTATSRSNLGDALQHQGRTAEAHREYQAALALTEERRRLFPAAPDVHADRVFLLAKLNRCSASHDAITPSLRQSEDPSELSSLAFAAALCDQTASALDYLRRAIEANASAAELARASELDSLRGTAEFHRLVGSGQPD